MPHKIQDALPRVHLSYVNHIVSPPGESTATTLLRAPTTRLRAALAPAVATLTTTRAALRYTTSASSRRAWAHQAGAASETLLTASAAASVPGPVDLITASDQWAIRRSDTALDPQCDLGTTMPPPMNPRLHATDAASPPTHILPAQPGAAHDAPADPCARTRTPASRLMALRSLLYVQQRPPTVRVRQEAMRSAELNLV